LFRDYGWRNRLLILRLQGINGYIGAVLLSFGKDDTAVHQCKEGVVFADAYIATGMMTGTSLADEDVATGGELTPKDLHAKSFAFGFAAVLGGTYAFLMCHIEGDF